MIKKKKYEEYYDKWDFLLKLLGKKSKNFRRKTKNSRINKKKTIRGTKSPRGKGIEIKGDR